jgi:hypothetical protein
MQSISSRSKGNHNVTVPQDSPFLRPLDSIFSQQPDPPTAQAGGFIPFRTRPVKRKRIRKSPIDPTPSQPRISRKLEAAALLSIDRLTQRESDQSIDGHFEFPYQKVLSRSTFQPAPPEPIHVSLDDDSTGQPLFEGGESDPPPGDLTVLANNLVECYEHPDAHRAMGILRPKMTICMPDMGIFCD